MRNLLLDKISSVAYGSITRKLYLHTAVVAFFLLIVISISIWAGNTLTMITAIARFERTHTVSRVEAMVALLKYHDHKRPADLENFQAKMAITQSYNKIFSRLLDMRKDTPDAEYVRILESTFSEADHETAVIIVNRIKVLYWHPILKELVATAGRANPVGEQIKSLSAQYVAASNEVERAVIIADIEKAESTFVSYEASFSKNCSDLSSQIASYVNYVTVLLLVISVGFTGLLTYLIVRAVLRQAAKYTADLEQEIQVRKQAEKAMLESKALVEAVLENVPLMIFLKESTDLRFVMFNRAGEELVGYNRESFLGKNNLDLFPPEQAANFMAKDREVLDTESGVVDIPEESITTARNGLRLLHTRKVCIRGADGVSKYVLGISEDITERKRAEQEHLSHLAFLESLEQVDHALRQADSLESMMMDVLGAALTIFACDRAWLVHPCDPESPVWSVRMEQTRPEYPGALVAGNDLPLTPDVRESFLELLNSRAPLVYDPRSGRSLPQSASQFSVQSQIQIAVYPKSGKPWVFGLHQCSHARVWKETDELLFTEIARRLTDGLSSMLFRQELQKSEEIFNRFMEHSPIYVFFKDEEMRSLRLSRNFETMLGKPLAELLGKSMDELFPSELAKNMVADDIRTMKEGKVVAVDEELDGRFYSTIKFPIVIDGKPRYLAGYTADITERKRSAEEKARLEDLLRQSQKVEAIGRLAGGVAHDFNNITAIVLGYAEMLLESQAPGDPSRKWTEQILEAGRRSAALTRQLLAFSRKQTLQPMVLELNALLRNLEKMLGRVIGEDIELRLELSADSGLVTADPGQIEQLVLNLVFNARDAMPQGGRLTIETAAVEFDKTYARGRESVVPGKYVMLAVTDTGCGMDKETMARLFEPFFTTKERGKGTGLGLATAHGIVKQSGGQIWAYSEPGLGTSFKIYLPWTDAQAAAVAVDAGEEAPRGRGELILLVEDEAPLRELCETILARLGYRAIVAVNGPQALRLVREQGLLPELVLTDVIMPGMSGAELMRQLHSERPLLPVLFMSGYPDDAIARHGILEPGIHFVQKPFTERVLATKVREALGAA
jgi:two-component system cell cycle sensor histidine kinase/response regulator CckA